MIIKRIFDQNHVKPSLKSFAQFVQFVEMHFHWGDMTRPKRTRGSEHTVDGKRQANLIFAPFFAHFDQLLVANFLQIVGEQSGWALYGPSSFVG